MHPPLSRQMHRVLPTVPFFHSWSMAKSTPLLSHRRRCLKLSGSIQQVNVKPRHVFSLTNTGIISCLVRNLSYEWIMWFYKHYSVQVVPVISLCANADGQNVFTSTTLKSSKSLEVLIMSQTCSVVWWSLRQVRGTCLILTVFWKWTSYPLSLLTNSWKPPETT